MLAEVIFLERVRDFFTNDRVIAMIRVGLLLAVGLPIAFLLGRLVGQILSRRATAQAAMLGRRIVSYGLAALVVATALNEMGFNLSVLLGAAGILTVAIGFASQTSASNLISGLFLIGERPFAVGDTIKVGDTTGDVLSIDLLSVRLRTFDNILIRLPNEMLIRSEIRNLTAFPIRRFDLTISVAYKESLPKVRDILFAVADRNPLSLEEPAPLFLITGFGDSGINIQFSVWSLRQNFTELSNSIMMEVKAAFDAAGIEMPFPHLSLYAGEASKPLQVQLTGLSPTAPFSPAPAAPTALHEKSSNSS